MTRERISLIPTSLVLIVALMIAALPRAVGAGPPVITAADSTFDFGYVPQQSTLVFATWLRNPGPDTTQINSIRTGCGCLTTLVQGERIPPADSIRVLMYWQTRAARGPVAKSAYIYTSGSQDPLTLAVSGRVMGASEEPASFNWAPLRLQFDSTEGPGAARSLELRSNGGGRLSVLKVEYSGERLSLDIPGEVPPDGRADGRVTLRQRAGVFEESFTLETSDENGYTYRVSVPVAGGESSRRPRFTTTGK